MISTAARAQSADLPDSRPDIWLHVRDIQRGNIDAFEHVYRIYVTEVRAYLSSLTIDATAAQDLTSETFIRAFKSIGSVEDRGKPLRAWLMTIARNIAKDHRRSWSVRHMVPVDQEVLLHACEPASTTEEIVVQREVTRWLWHSIEDLPPDQRECLVWRFLVGLSVDDTARRMCRSNGAVRAIQYRAVRKLGRLLNDQEGEPCMAD